MPDRRTVLKLAAAGLAAPPLLAAADPAPPLAPGKVPLWALDLPVPRVLTPVRYGGVDHYEMTQRAGQVQLLPHRLPATGVWGYDGELPGPTIVAERGRPVEVVQHNHLSQDVSTHLHGARSRSADDGQPYLPIAPGGRRTYRYENDQPGATLWYHDHADMLTSRHVYRGLAGLYLLHDPDEDRLGLPGGAYDVPLILQDRLFDVDGRLVYHDPAGADLLGNVCLANGAAWPRMRVAARRYRFRLLAASNSRPYLLGLTGRLPLTVVGSDDGLLERPVRTPTLLMMVAERYDVVVDFSAVPPGSSVYLQNGFGNGRLRDLVRFDVVRSGRDDSRVPDRLTTIPRLAAANAKVDRTWRFTRNRAGEYLINGLAYDSNRVDARPRLGAVEVWEFHSMGVGYYHPVHVHGTHFQVLSRDGSPPAPYERGRKDTVLVGEGSVVRVAMRFGPYPGRYVMHCHNLVHEDHSMMTQFEVVNT